MTPAVLVTLSLGAVACLFALLLRQRQVSRKPPSAHEPESASQSASQDTSTPPLEVEAHPQPAAPVSTPVEAHPQPAAPVSTRPWARELAAAPSDLDIPVHVSVTPEAPQPETLRPAPAEPDTARPPPVLPDTVRPMVATAPAREPVFPRPAALPAFARPGSPKSVPPRPTPRPPGTPSYVRQRVAPSSGPPSNKFAPASVPAPAPSEKAAPAPSEKAALAPSEKAAPAPSEKAAPAPSEKAAPAPRQQAAPEPPHPPNVVARAPTVDTAAIEKTDARHQAARKFARLAVSEIVLYRKAEVLEGRKAKDLWSSLRPDIKLCVTTYEQRVPKDVRDRFDYLYDEFVRQLAEGDPDKLGPNWPRPT
jgi:hypothetical protein